MSEQFEFKGPEVQKEAPLPEDFPVYPGSKFDESSQDGMVEDSASFRKYINGRASESGKKMFFDKKGGLDKENATRLWYGVAEAAHLNNYSVPKENPKTIEVGGILALKGIPFKNCFESSTSYKSVVALPENDLERQRVLDFQADLVMRSFIPEVREIIDNNPELKNAAEQFVKAKIQYEADRSRTDTLKNQDEEAAKLSEKIKEEYLSAEQEFDKIVAEQNIQF